VLSLSIAFGWRFVSEFLRADHRGAGRLSTYQWMAVMCVLYVIPAMMLLPEHDGVPRIADGLTVLRSPLTVLALAGLGLVVFLRLGISTITASIIQFRVASKKQKDP
jgi:hypothetical protein